MKAVDALARLAFSHDELIGSIPFWPAKLGAETVLLLGSRGYVNESPVERHYRDAPGLRIYEGTNLIQRIVVARALIGKEGA